MALLFLDLAVKVWTSSVATQAKNKFNDDDDDVHPPVNDVSFSIAGL